MEEKGYLLLALHTHLPFVRHPDIEHPQEENWLFEAITECYLPLIQMFKKLIADGVDFQITLSLTPSLVAMLTDALLQERYRRYIAERIELAKLEQERLRDQPAFLRLAQRYHDKFIQCEAAFAQDWNSDLTLAFKSLSDSGKVELITSAATHAYFPLWEIYPQAVELQVRVGLLHYQETFGKKPNGFWLPECGYYPACGFSPGADNLLQKAGIKYFFLESHGITNGHPRPKYGVHAPIHCPSGIAAFGRDWFCHNLVWCKEKGYAGDSAYMNIDRDIGHELGHDYILPFTHQDHPVHTGVKYFRNDGGVYDPEVAFRRCDEHANHFLHQCVEQVEQLYAGLGRKPVLVAVVDTEHFGHWWHEGPTWLDLAIRKLVYDQKTVKLITGPEYLARYPTNQVVIPSESSWGYQGYNETWLMERNYWIYPRLYQAWELLPELVGIQHVPQAQLRAALNQYLREFLLAQSSDWAFIMHKETALAYAEKRVNDHLENMANIRQQLKQNNLDAGWLNSLQNKNNIFSNMDLLDMIGETGV